MTHEEKIEHFLRELRAHGMRRINAVPPFLRLLWLLGMKVRPPYFMSFLGRVLFYGLTFGVFFGLFVWLIGWSTQGMTVTEALVPTAVAGVFFGFFMSMFAEGAKRRLALPRWSEYPGPHSADNERPGS